MGVMYDLLYKYKYYDTPEGEDCLYKIVYCTKFFALGGAVFGYYEAIGNRHLVPGETIPNFLLRGLMSVRRFAACGAIFASTSCLMASLRKEKNDHWNYVMGGIAAGASWGMLVKSAPQGYWAAAVFAAVAFAKKESRHKNYRFFPDPAVLDKYRQANSTLYFKDLDWSWVKLTKWQPRNKTYYFPGTVEAGVVPPWPATTNFPHLAGTDKDTSNAAKYGPRFATMIEP